MNRPTTESRASKFFDGYAHDFNAIYGNENTLFQGVLNKLFRKAMVMRYEKTLEGCTPIDGKSVLDIGCGPGHYGVALAKAGAKRVFGLDFAGGMLDVAKRNAEQGGVSAACQWEFGDFLTYDFGGEKFDYAVLMGFMDYIKDADKLIERVVQVTKGKAFFSFPADGGLLAWQRKLRYKQRCDLFMYTEKDIDKLFLRTKKPYRVETIDRDYFVTLDLRSN